MLPAFPEPLVCLAAYLLGSIPFGIVVSRVFGATDPRRAGSRNIGFTNVLRVSGAAAGVLTLIGDAGKGWLVGWLANSGPAAHPWALAAVFAVVLGHLFPIFINFRGGKGVATALGGILGLHAPLGIVLAAVWAAVVAVWKYSSGGAIAAFAAFPVCSWFMGFDRVFILFSVLLSALIVVRHKNNILRLYAGTESTMGQFHDKSSI